jgi:hypothetical protein
MSNIKAKTSQSPEGEEYAMFWLDEKQSSNLMNVLNQARMWLPTPELKKLAAHLYVNIGSQLGKIDEEEMLRVKIQSAML